MDMTLSERVEAAKNAVDICDVVSYSEPLKDNPGRYVCGVNHNSLVVDRQKQAWFWNSRGLSGDAITWYQEIVNPGARFWEALEWLESLSGGLVTPARAYTPKTPPKPVDPLSVDLAVIYHAALLESEKGLAWWAKRGISLDSIKRWVLGFKPDHWRRGPSSTIPLLENGELRTIRNRIWNATGDDERYLPEKVGLGSWVFNSDIIEGADEITIFEGEIKCMVMNQLGEAGVSISGCSNLPRHYWPEIAKVPKVYVCLDPVLNSKIEMTPYDIGWVQELYKETAMYLVRAPDKIDDMVIRNAGNYKAYLAIKKSAKRITDEDIQAAKDAKKSKRSLS